MIGTIEIPIHVWDNSKDKTKLLKEKIGVYLRIHPLTSHKFQAYLKKTIPEKNLYIFKFDTDIKYIYHKVLREGAKDAWLRNLEKAGWEVNYPYLKNLK